MGITKYNPSAGYNASANHRDRGKFTYQLTAYNKGEGVHEEVLTVRIYEGKVGTYAMVLANIAGHSKYPGSTGSAYSRMYSEKRALQLAFEGAGFEFVENYKGFYNRDTKELVREAASLMGYPDCHIFEAFP